MTMESGQVSSPGTEVPDYIYRDEDSNATPTSHITGGTADEIYIVEIDCRNNPGEDVYTRFYNDDGTPTVASDSAVMMLKGFKGKKKTVLFRRYDDAPNWFGIAFATGIGVATSKDAGAQTGATDPTGTVKIKLGVTVT